MNRQSGIELMRIIAIFMIMVVHATYMTFGFPEVDEIQTSPLRMFGYILVENTTIICVNVFILISGWFGMRPKIKNVGGLVFQSLFFGCVVQLFFHLMGISLFSRHTLNAVITFLPFVNAYIVLCLIAPLLNAYCESASKATFLQFLISYYTWGFVMGWFLAKDAEFGAGKTVVCFVGLYMLARYLRLHLHLSNKRKPWIWGCLFFLLIMSITASEVLLICNEHTSGIGYIVLNMTMSYLSPNVILASVLFFLCFVNISLKSKIINWIAISAFASVLLHGNMEIEYYCPMIRDFYYNNSFMIFILKSFVFMASFMFIGVFLDKIRVFLWNKMFPYVDAVFQKCFQLIN